MKTFKKFGQKATLSSRFGCKGISLQGFGAKKGRK